VEGDEEMHARDYMREKCEKMTSRQESKRREKEERNNQRHETAYRLFVLDDADLGGPQDTAVEAEALLLRVENSVVLLVGHGGHKGGLVFVGVELVAVRVEALEAVLLERLHQHILRHLDAVEQVEKVRVGSLGAVLALAGGLGPRGLGDHGQGAVQVVDAVDEVLGKAGNGKVAYRLDLALCAFLQVAEVGDGTEEFILRQLVGGQEQ
jgi:hypothetical protein